ncbi:MAG: AAA family ATPase [Limisphaerales bacterium]
MIDRVTIRNLKRFREQEFSNLGQLHLLVGPNNAGKSTLLHALAIWNYCVEEFRSSERTGNKAIEIALANFTPLPLNDFKLLWNEKTKRRYPVTDELDLKTKKPKRKQEFIPVEVEVHWRDREGEARSFTVSLRWHNQNTMYASPKGGWEEFRRLDSDGNIEKTAFPRIVYVPPHSNIAAQERPLDDANLRALVGEGRPGSVVRNLVWRTWRAESVGGRSNLGLYHRIENRTGLGKRGERSAPVSYRAVLPLWISTRRASIGRTGRSPARELATGAVGLPGEAA